MTHERIEPGDVFVRRFPGRDMIHVILPDSQWTAKVPFMRLSGVSCDSTYVRYRDQYGAGWQYVGTIPVTHLDYLQRNWTLR
jgi:hypothetical protein